MFDSQRYPLNVCLVEVLSLFMLRWYKYYHFLPENGLSSIVRVLNESVLRILDSEGNGQNLTLFKIENDDIFFVFT